MEERWSEQEDEGEEEEEEEEEEGVETEAYSRRRGFLGSSGGGFRGSAGDGEQLQEAHVKRRKWGRGSS